MIVCVKCGERNGADAKFCGNCSAFLEWDGARAEEPVQTVASQPAPVQPSEGRRPMSTGAPQATALRRPAPGDLICGQCGTGNSPVRRYCGLCGASLKDTVAVAQPWWRRWIPRRKAKELKAGTRPASHRKSGWTRQVGRAVRWAIAAVALVSGVLYGVHLPFRQAVNDQVLTWKRDVEGIFVTRLNPVRPTGVTATVELPDHAANLVGDNAFNTYWAAPVDQGETALVLTFDHPVDLRKAIVRVGIEKEFQSAHRPQKWHLVYSTGKTFDVDLADTPDPQEVALDGGAGSTSVEIHIVALNRSLQGTDVAISEIEFFERG